jgi:hypothetical protein
MTTTTSNFNPSYHLEVQQCNSLPDSKKGVTHDSSSELTAIDVSEVVDYFVYNYFNLMAKEPEHLSLFYREPSTFTFGFSDGKPSLECRGREVCQNNHA